MDSGSIASLGHPHDGEQTIKENSDGEHSQAHPFHRRRIGAGVPRHGGGTGSAQDRNPDGSVNPTASSVREDQLLERAQPDLRPLHAARPEGLHARAAGRARMAALPRGDAAHHRRRRDPRHAGAAGAVLSDPRHGADRAWPLRARAGALLGVRAAGALDDGDVLHRAGAVGPQHHVRPVVAAAADRGAGVRRRVAVAEIRAQLPELPVHARRAADVPDVDRLEYSQQGRRRPGSRKAAAWSAASIRRPAASTPARR